MESRKLLAVALLLIALTASLEYTPRNILLRVAIPVNAPYPLNDSPSGTSILWRSLGEAGYKTAIVYGLSGLPRLENVTDLVYLAVGGTLPEDAGLGEAYNLMKSAADGGVRVHYMLFDENPKPPIVNLTLQVSRLICGVDPPGVIGILNSSLSTYYGVAGGREYVLPTGYTGYIEWMGAPIAYPARPTLPQDYGAEGPAPSHRGPQGYGYRVIAAAWPYPSPPHQGEWYAVGVECSSVKGSVVIVADSTITVNLETGTVSDSIEYLESLVGERVESPGTTLVVSDEELYVAPGGEALQLVLSLHPSVLLVAVSRVYSSLESLALDALRSTGLSALIVAAVAATLVSAGVYSSIYGERRREPGKGRGRLSLTLPFGSWARAYSACGVAERHARIPTLEGGPLGEEAARIAGRIASRCERVRGANLFFKLLPVWGGVGRSVEWDLAVLLALTGAYGYSEARRIARGEGVG